MPILLYGTCLVSIYITTIAIDQISAEKPVSCPDNYSGAA